MITTVSIVDRLNEWKGWTDYRVSKMLEVSPQAVQHWRKSGVVMSDETAMKAAEILGLPPEFILANIHAERAKNTVSYEPLERLANLVEKENKKAIEAAESSKTTAA